MILTCEICHSDTFLLDLCVGRTPQTRLSYPSEVREDRESEKEIYRYNRRTLYYLWLWCCRVYGYGQSRHIIESYVFYIMIFIE